MDILSNDRRVRQLKVEIAAAVSGSMGSGSRTCGNVVSSGICKNPAVDRFLNN